MRTLFSKNIKHFSILESTNIEAENWILKNKPAEGSAVLADFQATGRGMGDNIWESDAKMNLLVSIILYPHFLDAADQFMLNKIIALSAKDCVRKFTGRSDVFIKWPNDIYVGKLKISGILSRNAISGNRIMHTIAGIGLNVNQTEFSSSISNPVSLKMITGKKFIIQDILDELLLSFEKYYEMLKDGNISSIDKNYLDSLFNFNRIASYSSEGKIFEGTITGVSPFGHLMMLINGSVKEFDLKEIQYIIE